MPSEYGYDPNDKRTFRRKTTTADEVDAAVAKDKFQDVSGLAAASRRAKQKKQMTAGDAANALAKRKKESY